MVFSSILFLFYFLPAILILYYIAPKRKRNAVLFFGSLFFYAWGEPVHVLLLIFSTIFNYIIGLKIEKNSNLKRQKKITLAFGIAVNLAFLVVFKYTDFLIEMLNLVPVFNIAKTGIRLPIGISFFTFQTISYIIDVYRNKVKAQKKYIDFGTYVALFPQLIAGPIVRYSSIDEQLTKRRETIEGFTAGTKCFVSGLAKKVLLANNIGLLWESVSAIQTTQLSTLTAWLGIIAYAFQIYFDFSGYSDMAIGLGKMFGFQFEQNFNYPYISNSITDFWRRWHISLSTWFKEYVYIPLGGNQKGKPRQFLNLLIVWTLTGIWHGAGLNFVVWGLYYAVILIAEKGFLGRILDKMTHIIRIIYSIILVLVGWVFFASADIGSALSYIKIMFFANGTNVIDGTFLYSITSYAVLLVVSLVAILPYPKKMWEKVSKGRNSYALILVILAIILSVAYLLDSSYNPFLYFRF